MPGRVPSLFGDDRNEIGTFAGPGPMIAHAEKMPIADVFKSATATIAVWEQFTDWDRRCEEILAAESRKSNRDRIDVLRGVLHRAGRSPGNAWGLIAIGAASGLFQTIGDIDALIPVNGDNVGGLESALRRVREVDEQTLAWDDAQGLEDERRLWDHVRRAREAALEVFASCIEGASPEQWQRNEASERELIFEARSAGQRLWIKQVANLRIAPEAPRDIVWLCKALELAALKFDEAFRWPGRSTLRGYSEQDIIRLAWCELYPEGFVTNECSEEEARRDWNAMPKDEQDDFIGFSGYLFDMRTRAWGEFLERIEIMENPPLIEAELEERAFCKATIASLSAACDSIGALRRMLPERVDTIAALRSVFATITVESLAIEQLVALPGGKAERDNPPSPVASNGAGDVPPEHVVGRAEIAAMAKLSSGTLKAYLSGEWSDFPPPFNEKRPGKSLHYDWREVRPYLLAKFPGIDFPETYPRMER